METAEVIRIPVLQKLVDGLAGALEERLVSVVLYGSGARGDYEQATSDLNLIVVCRDLDPETLGRLAAPIHEWTDKKQPMPRFMTPAIISDAADVFPIEFLDLKQRRVVLRGDDPFASVAVHRQHLRHQCERELREKMMRLREGYIEVHRKPKRLRALLIDSFGSFIALFRGCLHLHDETIPEHNEEVVAAFCRLAELDQEPFDTIERLRGSREVPDDLEDLFARYYAQLTEAVARVDRFDAY